MNAVGVWLAVLLLWPELNEWIAPFTYGRWMPVHLDGQLYGWCALPLVGVLFQYYRVGDSTGRIGLWLWTGALAFAALTWLAGGASGKLFLNFAGPARIVWTAAQLGLWGLLAWTWWQQTPRSRPAGALLLLLLAVPFVLFRAADPAVFPAVNPHSGGATGASLLGSTLALLLLFGLLPHLLGLPRLRRDQVYWPGFLLSTAYYAGMRHADASHHEIGQIIGLALLVGWIPLVLWRARSYRWSEMARQWLQAAFWWWLAIVVDGLLTFLPGVSERLKFTNALVAHSHLAMAGMVTGLHGVLLVQLGGSWRVRPWAFWLWQGACAVHVVGLLWLGWQEGADPAILYLRGGAADWVYGLRLAAGLAMLAASLQWLRAAWQHD